MSGGFDAVIREVSVYDGTGTPPRLADVALEGGRIASVGQVAGAARETVDGRGLALAPGFIDVHTHDDFAAVMHPEMSFKLVGGVTTCIVGNCGFGAAPFAAAAVMAKTLHPKFDLPAWDGYAGYAQGLERNRRERISACWSDTAPRGSRRWDWRTAPRAGPRWRR